MATDTGGAPYAGGSLAGATIQFEDGRIKQTGQDLGEQAPNMNAIAQNVGGIRVEPPAFGVIGMGLNHAHDQLKDNAHNTLKTARDVLSDYRTALAKLEENYQKADKDNDGIIKTDPYAGPGTGPGTGPGIDPASLGTGMPKTGDLPSSKFPGSELPDSKLPDSKLPDSKLPDSKLPDTDLPDPNAPNPNLPDPNAPDPNLPNTDLPDPNTTLPTTPSIEDQLNHNVPSVPTVPNTSLPTDPTKTDLANFDPSKLGTIPTPSVPGNTTTVGPGLSPAVPRASRPAPCSSPPRPAPPRLAA
ncbi:hypothetical protein ACFQ0B_03250 [Nonomuraea thailandensis]